jgi:hypothetical protein
MEALMRFFAQIDFIRFATVPPQHFKDFLI